MREIIDKMEKKPITRKNIAKGWRVADEVRMYTAAHGEGLTPLQMATDRTDSWNCKLQFIFLPKPQDDAQDVERTTNSYNATDVLNAKNSRLGILNSLLVEIDPIQDDTKHGPLNRGI